ncbi:MAG: hypothetical protein AUJ92_17645 [Armatimonadetes bacterium CG2_30_59_28]|nr:bifunctional precorrin-2 dehydrogenase/sirohydrochlorin ferrochelatase [Armatimonadota bacterium]OIO90908.1 MAG: hypothetical protein AUJ92_17645 [Armatimonadetes bacterium CG2_30_59_28]PIU64187.1 MAG: siroheme synthase [Armatimonadetes bacterium CG07_land_8_20_14_0_80_59_28]PIY48095.1 MAG: siroheme synthase [Armatimonadetes bacterium CG_4_10_14_3_um_filter_59_10]
MSGFYSVALRVEGRRCVVIGGGKVAERRIAGLLEASARVTVISPQLSAALQSLVATGDLNWISRDYDTGDLDDTFLAVAATDDVSVNRAVVAEAKEKGALCNSATDPRLSDFHLPAILRRGGVVVSVSTTGSSPVMARWLRDALARYVSPVHGELADLLAKYQIALKERYPEVDERSRKIRQLIEETLFLSLQEGHRQAAEEAIQQCIS